MKRSRWVEIPLRKEENEEEGPASLDDKAQSLVRAYIEEHLDKSAPAPWFDVYIVWKCKILQNWKYLLSSTLNDGMYYELTFNGDKQEFYLDAYKKFENRVIPWTESESKP